MRSDILKTMVGLVIIGLIVVATFLYGNAQREAQLARDQELKRAQTTTAPSPSASASPEASKSPAASPSPATAAVISPSPNAIQGGRGGSATPTPTASPKPTASPAASPKPAATPAVNGATTTMPETGMAESAVIAMTVISLAFMAHRRSQRSLIAAVRSRG